MKRTKDDLQVVQLEPDTLEKVNVWPSVTKAALGIKGTREAIYQATRDGSVRFGYRWMFYPAYQTWERTHGPM